VRSAAALALLALAICGCGRSGDRQAVRHAAAQFYAAVDGRDGERACALLSTDTRKALEDQESEPCDEAVVGLDLTGGPVGPVDVYSTEASVELRGGDTVFLQDTREGWRIAAAGCRPQAHEEPAKCEVQA
jgi:hypothetical protein